MTPTLLASVPLLFAAFPPFTPGRHYAKALRRFQWGLRNSVGRRRMKMLARELRRAANRHDAIGGPMRPVARTPFIAMLAGDAPWMRE